MAVVGLGRHPEAGWLGGGLCIPEADDADLELPGGTGGMKQEGQSPRTQNLEPPFDALLALDHQLDLTAGLRLGILPILDDQLVDRHQLAQGEQVRPIQKTKERGCSCRLGAREPEARTGGRRTDPRSRPCHT